MSGDLHFARVDTVIGPMLVAATAHGVAAISRQTDTGAFLTALHRRYPHLQPVPDAGELAGTVSWLRRCLQGRERELAPVDLGGIGTWDQCVYEAIREIPFGGAATYGEIAALVRSPRAARAVGGALSRCPLFPAVPCHRVVMAGDGFSGWGGSDIEVKRRLIDLERARLRVDGMRQ